MHIVGSEISMYLFLLRYWFFFLGLLNFLVDFGEVPLSTNVPHPILCIGIFDKMKSDKPNIIFKFI